MPWWGYVVYTLIMTHITMVSVTVYLHRHQAHRGLDLHPAVAHFFRFWLWLTTGMKTKEWVAVHRKHHAKCETAEDPHSPQVQGLNKVLWEGAELYRNAKKDLETLDKYGKGTPGDWMERNVYSCRFMRGKQGVAMMLLINLALFGVPGLIIWGIQMAWTPFWAAGVINGVGHFFGYRNFECEDASTNILPWGILIAGEELHNNHHAYGTSAKLSVKWYEFDIGWMYIRTLQAFGLANVKRLPPKAVLDANKLEVDMDTVKAVISNRMHLLACYSKNVIKPVFKHERRTNSDMMQGSFSRRMRNLLIRDRSLVKWEEQQQLELALKASDLLHTVYQYRNQLQSIWERTSTNNKELLESLQDWCKRAEQSGIKALQDFVQFVRAYHVEQKV
jgi:stearoyl-CoA desaturase (delta-9 desaturase)